ncbi:hypothetical protein PVK06_011384 [Gossypium arboreum]|uniref:Reverse transcriptase domain-containing protein n=1 Tax=Gossypium arboreum TaxID=29729 RepID=A0ABR0Q8P0_GOSAR|nr:hypothetical protein PVK06_011384 [Gossypium arboreum]
MGFDAGWVDSLMKCVSTISYSVVLNGHTGENFSPTRGLRQGDPLSLFLFLIYREGLSSFIRLTIQGNILRGIKANRDGPQCVNYYKSTVLVSTNTQEGDRIIISRILRVRSYNNPERYLGFPNMGRHDDRISIWGDLWILGAETDKLQMEANNENIKLVSDLIDADNKTWSTSLIFCTFNEDTAKKILQIPLAETIYDDFQV